MAFLFKALMHHKYAAPSTPKLDALRSAISAKLQPIYFHIKNDPNYGTYVYDEHFYGVLCSPLFEGKTYTEINAMVDQILEPLGLKAAVRLNCQPPSRFFVSYPIVEDSLLSRNYGVIFVGGGMLIADRACTIV